MDLTMPQKKKHLLLLNRIIRAETKKDIIPVPSKLTEDEVNKYFKQLFIEKDGYYIPIKNKLEISIDEELFKGLIKRPKTKEQKKEEKEMKKEEEKVMSSRIQTNIFNKFTKDFIKPYLEKRKSGENVSKDEINMVDKYIKLGPAIKKMIEKASPKLWEMVLNPAFKEYQLRKETLKEEDKQLMKKIKTEAKEEKRMMKNKEQ